MTRNSDSADYNLDEYLTEDFDPLGELSFDDDFESVLSEGPFNVPNSENVPAFQKDLASFTNGDSPAERIDALFDQMPTLQKMLFAILDSASTPVATEYMETVITAMKKHHHSVYEPLTFCDLLERAGALQQTDEEGLPLSDVEQEPLFVEIDGETFWRVAPAPSVYWYCTEEGKIKLDSYQPFKLITQCYEAEPQYADIFTTCMEIAQHSGGSSLREIGDVVDDEPIVQNPRRYAMYFIDKLERAGALEWTGQWSITEAGRTFLNNRNEN